MGNLRELIEEPTFAAAKIALGKAAQALDDHLRAVEFLLARLPSAGVPVPDTDILAIPTSPGRGFDNGLVVFYRVGQQERVHLLDLIEGAPRAHAQSAQAAA